jgi:hypothetical protein
MLPQQFTLFMFGSRLLQFMFGGIGCMLYGISGQQRFRHLQLFVLYRHRHLLFRLRIGTRRMLSEQFSLLMLRSGLLFDLLCCSGILQCSIQRPLNKP